MSDLADYLEQAVQTWAFDNDDMDPAPTNQYVALHDADPTSDGSANEFDAASYDRYEADPTEWDVSGSGPTVVTNTADLEFGVAAENWGTVSHVSVWDGPEGTDNCLWNGAFDEPKAIDENDEFVIRSGDISFELD